MTTHGAYTPPTPGKAEIRVTRCGTSLLLQPQTLAKALAPSPSPAAQNEPFPSPPGLPTPSLIRLPVAGLGLAWLIVPSMTHAVGRGEARLPGQGRHGALQHLQAQLSKVFPSHACLLALPGLCALRGAWASLCGPAKHSWGEGLCFFRMWSCQNSEDTLHREISPGSAPADTETPHRGPISLRKQQPWYVSPISVLSVWGASGSYRQRRQSSVLPAAHGPADVLSPHRLEAPRVRGRLHHQCPGQCLATRLLVSLLSEFALHLDPNCSQTRPRSEGLSAHVLPESPALGLTGRARVLFRRLGAAAAYPVPLESRRGWPAPISPPSTPH